MKTKTSISQTGTENTQSHDCHEEVTRALPPTLGELIRTKFASLWNRRPHLVHLAITEARALAGRTDFPQLFLPALALEKVETAAAWHRRQEITRLGQNPTRIQFRRLH